MKNGQWRLSVGEGLVILLTLLVVGGLSWSGLENSWRMRRDIGRKVDLGEISRSIEAYVRLHDRYPPSTEDDLISGCGLQSDQRCLWGARWFDEAYVYLEVLPEDERAEEGWLNYGYRANEGRSCFYLWAFLERKVDEDILPSHQRCPGDWEENQFVACQCQ